MTYKEQEELQKEYVNANDERRSDIVQLFANQYSPLIRKLSKYDPTLMQEALISIHESLLGSKLEHLATHIRFAIYHQRHFNNKLLRRSQSIEITPDIASQPDYEETYLDKEIPPVPDLLNKFFLQNKTIEQIYNELPDIPIKPRKMKGVVINSIKTVSRRNLSILILNEINTFRLANDKKPFDSLHMIKSNFLPQKAIMTLWQRNNKDRVHEYYERAKAKGQRPTKKTSSKNRHIL